jgi:hypothetical protein
MLTAHAEKLCGIATNGYLGPADVCDVQNDVIYLSIPGLADRMKVAGTLAISKGASIHVGTRVLVAAQHMDDVYIIGILEPSVGAKQNSNKRKCVNVDVTVGEGENLRVFSAKHELLFEHDAHSCMTRVHVPTGDLAFVASEGNIRFEAAAGITVKSKLPVQVQSESAIQLGIRDSVGCVQSEYVLGSHDHRIETPQLRLKTASLQAQASETRFTSQTLRARFGNVRIMAQTMETVAETLIQKTKDSLARISGLWQVKSGRTRCESEASMYLKSKNVCIQADDDVKINGDQIHLG